jgi:ATP-dependent DNA ligase
MAPTLVREPFHRDGWIYEEKVDGWRMLAYKSGDRVRVVNRNGRDNTRRFADLPAAIAELSARSLVLDGEVAIFDQPLRSRFEWLRDTDPDVVPRHRLAAGDGHPAARRLAPVADGSVPSTETERGHA